MLRKAEMSPLFCLTDGSADKKIEITSVNLSLKETNLPDHHITLR